MKAVQLIQNEEMLRRFCDEVLPPLEHNECFFVMLSARNKYLTEEQKETVHLRKGSDMLGRIICRSNEFEEVKRTILKLTPVEGLYTDSNGVDIPENAYTVYITPNPRSITKATPKIISNFVESLVNQGNEMNVNNAVYAEIHKSCGRKLYFDVDIDLHDKNDIAELDKIVEEISYHTSIHALTQVKTAGGAHILLNLKAIQAPFDKTWYRNVEALKTKYKAEIEMKSDTMVPICGCSQGGKFPFIRKINIE